VLRTGLIESHGLKFDEEIVIGPDWDFFAKYAELGDFGYIDQTTCLYRIHTSNISLNTGLKKRALELAKCRVNAIGMAKFDRCSIKVQTAVFHDLLVNLLLDYPERQSEISRQPEFAKLPKREQARLLRLMASKTMLHGKDQSHVKGWLERARHLYPSDWRTGFLWLLFRIHPNLLRKVLRVRNVNDIDMRSIPPFADIKMNGRR
jgi:hypothetical protein